MKDFINKYKIKLIKSNCHTSLKVVEVIKDIDGRYAYIIVANKIFG